jgi:hypothetical protein
LHKILLVEEEPAMGRPVERVRRRKAHPVRAEAVVRQRATGALVRVASTPRPSQEDIELRAVEISEAKGEAGHLTLDDWLQAECDLLFWESLMVRS